MKRIASIALALEAGGAVHVVGGDTKVVRVRVSDRGRHCADCIVAVHQTLDGIEVRTARTRRFDTPADLRVQIDGKMLQEFDALGSEVRQIAAVLGRSVAHPAKLQEVAAVR